METEKEYQRPSIHKRKQPMSRPARPMDMVSELPPTQASYVREVCVVMGAIFILIGLVGLVVPDLLNAHLSYSHNVVHLVSGVLSLYFGFATSVTAARTFAYAFAVFYGGLALLGYTLGEPGMASVGHIAEDSNLWRVIPGSFELGSADHNIHIAIAAVFLLGALLRFKPKNQIVYH